jgi:hypothetical protein
MPKLALIALFGSGFGFAGWAWKMKAGENWMLVYYLGMQLGGVLSTSHEEKSFMGTGLVEVGLRERGLPCGTPMPPIIKPPPPPRPPFSAISTPPNLWLISSEVSPLLRSKSPSPVSLSSQSLVAHLSSRVAPFPPLTSSHQQQQLLLLFLLYNLSALIHHSSLDPAPASLTIPLHHMK